MKNLFVLLVAALLQPTLAQAERFIVKNPQGPVIGTTVQTMQFGADTYVVVEAPAFAHLLASFAPGADAVTPDLVIGLSETPKAEDEAEEALEQPAAKKAWHPEALRYGELPSSRDGGNLVVAVLDTGVDYTHPNLKDNIFVNQGEIAGNGIDDDGNGYIDDVSGYDFDSKDADPRDAHAHGTHCAGIIGGTPDSATGALGVAQGVKIMPIRIIGSEQTGFLSNAAAAIKYAVDNGAKVLSNSWRVYRRWDAFDPSDSKIELLRAAIQYANERGVVFVAASGNESFNMDTGMATDPLYPAGFTGLDNLVVVGASNRTGRKAYFSNYGANYVTVAAPGDGIVSTMPGGKFDSMSGTSMAAPIVAGAIARGLGGGMSFRTAMDKLESTSDQGGDWAGKVRAGGVINLVKYLGE